MKEFELFNLTFEEKKNWIFSLPEIDHEKPISRFDSICTVFFDDVQLFVDSILNEIKNKGDEFSCYAGILSLPKLICSSLELVSYHYTNEKNARKSAQKFIEKYFSGVYSKIPLIFWDSCRNGMIHSYYPKSYSYNEKKIVFRFFIQDSNIPSFVEENDSHYIFSINCFELYRVYKESIERYHDDLEKDESLQNTFIQAFCSLDRYEPLKDTDKIKEITRFFTQMNEGEIILLKNGEQYVNMLEFFCNPKKNKDLEDFLQLRKKV